MSPPGEAMQNCFLLMLMKVWMLEALARARQSAGSCLDQFHFSPPCSLSHTHTALPMHPQLYPSALAAINTQVTQTQMGLTSPSILPCDCRPAATPELKLPVGTLTGHQTAVKPTHTHPHISFVSDPHQTEPGRINSSILTFPNIK